MKVFFVVILAAIFVAGEDLPLAQTCVEESCELPNCRCSSSDVPGSLNVRDVPQFVSVTFDDGINVLNIETYRRILYSRSNKNGCKAGATFYVNHEYTNYQLVNELYNNGFEIALHSISHQTSQNYWAQSTYEDMRMEFGDQILQMTHFANIPREEIKGVRIPFLQMTGNNTFQVMADVGLQYDCTWPTVNHINTGLWPYTLDYASIQDCPIPPCPTASIPGVWVIPMINWIDLNGNPCAMVDSCFGTPSLSDENGWFQFIMTNFERHYLGHRTPFGFYIHEWYLSTHPAIERAFVRFMDVINQLDDVFMVNAGQIIEWMKDPKPVDEYIQKDCRTFVSSGCAPNSCGPLFSEHNNLNYWMAACTSCPNTYPWLGNPLGV